MELTVTAKQLGKKHALIEKKIIEIEEIGTHPTLHDLIAAVVRQQIQDYNSRAAGKSILPFLDSNVIEDQAANGKVSFNAIYSESNPDFKNAIATAMQAFEDGVFVVFADDNQFSKSDDVIFLKPDTVITFIRLSFLAGSYW